MKWAAFFLSVFVTIIAVALGSIPVDRKTCPELATGNYQIWCSRERYIGSVCKISCSKGSLDGVSRIVCTRSGNWSKSLEGTKCVERKTCPELPKSNYRIWCTRERYVGSVCKISCSKGSLDGVSRVVCTRSGNWSKSLEGTKCERVVVDRRCPKVRRIPILSYLGLCSKCPKTCPKGHICCDEPRCGTRCIPIPRTATCSPLLSKPDGLNFQCTKHSYVGSICKANCPPGSVVEGIKKIFCNRNGYWTPTVEKSRCIPDPRCPKLRNDTVGICPICPKTCPDDTICCSTGCGTACVKAVARCPVPLKRRNSFNIECSDGFNLGSLCQITCPEGKFLSGVEQIQCLSTGEWNNALKNTQCIPNQDCPPGVPVAGCTDIPCEVAACPGVPKAVCVNNFCGGCNFKHFVNGREISKRLCIPREDCSRARSYRPRGCRNPCFKAKCPGQPDAICRGDCKCTPRFYDSNTFEEAKCKKEPYGREEDDRDDDKKEEDDDQ